MSPTLKKILLIIGLLALAGLIAFGLYKLFTRAKPAARPPITGAPGVPTAPGQLPGAGGRVATTGVGVAPGAAQLPSAGGVPGVGPSFYQPEAVTKVVSEYAIYPSVGKDGGLRFHNASDGKFYHRLADGSIKSLSDQTFYNVKNVTWGNTSDKAVIEYPDGNKIIYNFDEQKQVTLPKHWEEFSFANDDAQIAAKSVGLSPENRWLVTVNDDGTGTKVIEPMGNNQDKVIVDWSPSRQTVAFSKTADPIGGERQMILLVGQNHENFRGLTVEGLGFRPQWSPSGQRLLYSVYSGRSDYKPELWISNAYGDAINTGRQTVGLNTWADKCAFAGETVLYCAVPRDLPRGAGMMPSVAEGSDYDLYKVDLTTNLKTNISLGTENYKIDTVMYDNAKNKIIFTDKTKTGVFEVNI